MPSADTPKNRLPLEPGSRVILPSGRFAVVIELDRKRQEATVEWTDSGRIESANFRTSLLTRIA